ncbi:NADH-quinone oxidoreductase subunit M, partial [Micromonospora aurantiaca]
HGRPSPAVAGLAPGLAGAELTAWAPLVLLALAVGLAPALVLSYASGPVEALLGVVP